MTEIQATVTQVLQGVEVDLDNTVLSAQPASLFGAIEGMCIEQLNGAPVSNRSELREELQQILAAAPAGTTMVKLLLTQPVQKRKEARNPAAVRGALKSNKDEFELNSDDESPREGGSVLKVKTVAPAMSAAARLGANVTVERAEKVLADGAGCIGPGRCIILLCDGFNPAVQVEAAAKMRGASVMHIDPVARIKTRQRLEEYAVILRRSLEKGVWIFMENATKSITLLDKLAESIAEVRKLDKLHPESRILLMCEPHPHFPIPLLEGSVTLRLRLSASTKTDISVEEALSESRTKLTLIRDQSAFHDPSLQQPPRKRKVKMATEVDVVKIESSAFLEMSQSTIAGQNGGAEGDGRSGGQSGEAIERVAKYRFGPNEKMISLCRVGDDRFAVGTSSGYVVVLDRNGLPMIQYRPHKACIWDVTFGSSYDFSTASEDGTSSIFFYDLAEQELEAASVASFQSDVFAVAYAREWDPTSPVLSGGLSSTVCVLHSDRKSSSFVPASTSIQAMCSVPGRNHVVVGGGNGAVILIDPETSRVVETSMKHVRKVPAVSAVNSMVLTGSFDKTLRVWDTRSGLHCSHNLVMTDVLTATAISETHIAACSGSNLFVWDLRALHQVLAVRNKAWNGLTRGLVLDGNSLVTASVDGAARFWEFK